MNVETANATPLSSILLKIGCNPVKHTSKEAWYHSPLREERTASFHIHTSKNVWYDFGIGKGGNVLTFIITYLESHNEDHTVVDALRWLDNMFDVLPTVVYAPAQKKEDGEETLKQRKVGAIQNIALLKYLDERGIPQTAAKKYLKEVYVHNKNSGKSFFALGLSNENGGYELRNGKFKGSLSPKGISFIRGARLLHDEIHVFEA